MANFYEVIEGLENGQMIKNDEMFNTFFIKKINGALMHTNKDGEVRELMGKQGHVIMLGNMNSAGNWSIVEEFIEIDLNEVKELLSDGKTVYVDSDKKPVRRLTDLVEVGINDFEDAFLFTAYYKKA